MTENDHEQARIALETLRFAYQSGDSKFADLHTAAEQTLTLYLEADANGGVEPDDVNEPHA